MTSASRRSLVALGLAFSFGLAVAAHGPSAAASVSIALTVNDLTKSSDVIAIITPLTKSTAWVDGRIMTTTHARVDEVVAVSAQTGASTTKEIDVRTLGGIVGEIGQSVAGEPVLAPNQQAVAFLAKKDPKDAHYFVVGRAQGYFQLEGDAKADRNAKMLKQGYADQLVARVVRTPEAPSTGPMAAELHNTVLPRALDIIRVSWKATREVVEKK